MEHKGNSPYPEKEPGHDSVIAKSMSEEYRKNVAYWDNFSKNYDEDIDFSYGSGVRSMGLRRLREEGRFGNAVEFACGSGYFSKALSEMCDRVQVTDLSEKFLSIAKERLKGLTNISFGIADCEQTCMPDNEYDLVFTGLLGNSIDVGKTYREFYRILKPAGTYITYVAMFSLMDAELLRQLHLRQISRGRTTAPPKYYEQSFDAFRETAEKSGFKVIVHEQLRDHGDPNSVPFMYMKCIKI